VVTETGSLEPGDALSAAARQLQSASDTDELLQQIVQAAVATLDACTYAGISVDRNGHASSPVVSDKKVLEIDQAQYTAGRGPCLSAMRGEEAVVDSPDLPHDDRWPDFGQQAAELGITALMAHRLYVDSHALGSLNLYSAEHGGFTAEDRRRMIVLSALASLAINAVLLEADAGGLREALRSRDVIGQAKGIIMEREDCDEDAAFERLRKLSQTQNNKLRDVAQAIVDARGTDPAAG
jgi:GAF domain-containing protein